MSRIAVVGVGRRRVMAASRTCAAALFRSRVVANLPTPVFVERFRLHQDMASAAVDDSPGSADRAGVLRRKANP